MIDHRRNVMPGTRYFFTVTPADRASRLWIERIAYLCVGFRVMRLDSRVSQTALNPDYNDYFDAYDERGHLIGEYNANGSAIQETVYLGNQPVAVFKQNNLYTIHTDHLNTPRAISDSGNTVIWRWDADPFGTAAADPDPDMNGVKFTYNLRFPGQYFDSETGLHYNYFRDYDPSTGRYIESDPVGLNGGINTYTYAANSPLRYIDPKGLLETEPPIDPQNPRLDPNNPPKPKPPSGIPGQTVPPPPSRPTPGKPEKGDAAAKICKATLLTPCLRACASPICGHPMVKGGCVAACYGAYFICVGALTSGGGTD